MAETAYVHIGNILPGETLVSPSSLRIQGDIGAGAKIRVNNGGLIITGTVGDNAVISAGNRGNDSRGGRVKNKFNEKAAIYGLKIEGAVGNNVTLETSSSITLLSYAGSGLKALAKANSFNAKTVDSGAIIKAGNSANIEIIGAGSKITVANSANISNIGPECIVEAGNSVNAFSIGYDSQVKAGNSVRAQISHASAKIKAGNKIQVGKYVDCTPVRPKKPGGTEDTGPK